MYVCMYLGRQEWDRCSAIKERAVEAADRASPLVA
jgi:hypothetical protein